MPRPTTPARTSDPTDDCHALSTAARSIMSGLSPPSRAQRDARDRSRLLENVAVRSIHTGCCEWCAGKAFIEDVEKSVLGK
jgi:hypothetical protein